MHTRDALTVQIGNVARRRALGYAQHQTAAAEAERAKALNIRAYLDDSVLSDDAEIGYAVLHILRDVIVANRKDIEVEFPHGLCNASPPARTTYHMTAIDYSTRP